MLHFPDLFGVASLSSFFCSPPGPLIPNYQNTLPLSLISQSTGGCAVVSVHPEQKEQRLQRKGLGPAD